jgi:hypothetical protein
LLRYTGRIDAAEAPFVCHDGVAGIPLIEGHLAVAGSGLAFPLAAARETFANLPGIERREMSTESFSICDAALYVMLPLAFI